MWSKERQNREDWTSFYISYMKFQRLWSFIQSHTHTHTHTHIHTHTQSVLTDLLSFPTGSLNLPEQSCGWENSRGGVISGALCKTWVSHKVNHTLSLVKFYWLSEEPSSQVQTRQNEGEPLDDGAFFLLFYVLAVWRPRCAADILSATLWSSQPMTSGKHTRARP